MYSRLIPLLLLFLCAILIVAYFVSPLSKIGTISVDGNSDVTDQKVINSSQLVSGLPLWDSLWNDQDVEKAVLEDLPQVKTLELNRQGWNDILIKIVEYKIIAYSYNNNEYFPILENGKIVDESRKVSMGNNPIFKNFSEGKPLNYIIEQYNLLNSSVQNSVSEIEHTPSETDQYLVTVYMNDGNQVVATLPTFAEKMNYYPDMVQKIGKQNGIINLEVGGYFVPFEEENNELLEESEDEVDLEKPVTETENSDEVVE
ncbi:FtsQ-type POTRA domain-containing protein [Desemzia sp. RIT804]|nr:FtsQ-type POTRA domain-containing protein [Desemzia sp. RIT 804]